MHGETAGAKNVELSSRMWLCALLSCIGLGSEQPAAFGAASADSTLPAPSRALPPKRVYHATRVSENPPLIDGQLDDRCWHELGAWAGDYTQREPREGEPASQPTELKILYDDHHVYVAFRCHDSELGTVQHLRGNHDEFTGEMVGLALDSYFDQRTGFEFDVTSGGSKIDLVIRNDVWDTSWNPVWEAKVGRESGAWTAEFRIPLSQLRYANKPAHIWGLHSWRWIKRHQEESNWQLLPMDNPGFVFCFGELHGIENLPRARNIEVVPYAVAKHATSRAEAGNPFRTGAKSDFAVGLDAKIGVTSDLTVDLTINPDFGQIGADPSEINLSTYETFVSERRPFFLEGKNIFDWSTQGDVVFYSRRIGDRPGYDPLTTGFKEAPTATRILGAAKLTGKSAQGLSIGTLYAITARETARIREGATDRRITVEPLTHYFVARAQQDIAKGRTIVGGVVTATLRDLNEPALEFMPEAAYTSAFDLQHFWAGRACKLDVRLMGSLVEGSTTAISQLMRAPVHNYQRPDALHLGVDDDAHSLSGHGGTVRVGKDNGGNWRYSALVDWRSPGLELNDLGYLYVADRVRETAILDYVDTDPGKFHRRFNVRLRGDRAEDFDGMHLHDGLQMEGDLTFNRNWSLGGRIGYVTKALDTRILRGGPGVLRPPHWEREFRWHSDSTRPWQYEFEIEHDSTTVGGSRRMEFSPGISARPLDLLTLGFNVSAESRREDLQYVTIVPADTRSDARYIIGRMDQRTLGMTLRVDLNFTPTFSLAWYGSLFASSGEFAGFKRIIVPRASVYAGRFTRLDGFATLGGGGRYRVQEGAATYGFDNPDFDWRELKSNLVFRWEYRPGSTVFVVWTQNRTDAARTPGFDRVGEYRRLFSVHPENTFLVKASYWFSL